MKSERYYAHGKLLLTGEYGVLDGALALALPTKLGQSLRVDINKNSCQWVSKDHQGNIWFQSGIQLEGNTVRIDIKDSIGSLLEHILNSASELNPNFIKNLKSPIWLTTNLEFDRSWGLGSSSTLLSLVSQWAGVNPFLLQKKSLEGSGYDLACATQSSPLTYRLKNGVPEVTRAILPFDFLDKLHFVYLGNKQNSREGIRRFNVLHNSKKEHLIEQQTVLTSKLLETKSLKDFKEILEIHESLVSSHLALPTIKESRFPDCPFPLKSLGAWGGDFILAVGEASKVVPYFKPKGIALVFPYQNLILNE